MSDQHRNERVENVSAAFDLLRNARRRGVLYTLKRDGETSVEELARRIAAWQSGATDPAAVETSLIHSHLPKLAAAGVVDYDRDRGVVELADADDHLDSLLRSTRKHEPALFRASGAPTA